MAIEALRQQAHEMVARLLPTDLDGPRTYSEEQLDGRACLRCDRCGGADQRMVPITTGRGQLFVCAPHCPPFALPWLPRVRLWEVPGWCDLLSPAGVVIKSVSRCPHCHEWMRDWILHAIEECPCNYGATSPGCHCPEMHADA